MKLWGFLRFERSVHEPFSNGGNREADSRFYGVFRCSPQISRNCENGEPIGASILLPAHAPPEYADRETFWNAVEERGSILASRVQARFSGFRIFSATRGTTQKTRAIPEPTTRFPTRFFPATGTVFSVLSEGLAEL